MMVTRAGFLSAVTRCIWPLWPRTYKVICLTLPPSKSTLDPPMSSTDATTATATESAAGPVPPTRPARQNSLAETVQTLEKRLAQRPDRQELEDRNILRDGNIAPALQATRDQLQRSQLEDKLDQKLLHRPKPEELVASGILKPEEIPPST